MLRGSIVNADLPPPKGKPGREQFGARPVLLVDNFQIRARLATAIIVPFTTNQAAMRFAGSVLVDPSKENGLSAASVALTHQLRAIDKGRLKNLIGTLEHKYLDQIDRHLRALLAL